jgi:hypothetical protein
MWNVTPKKIFNVACDHRRIVLIVEVRVPFGRSDTTLEISAVSNSDFFVFGLDVFVAAFVARPLAFFLPLPSRIG